MEADVEIARCVRAALIFTTSFFISTVLNFGLSRYFLGDLDHAATNARELYNNSLRLQPENRNSTTDFTD